MSPLTSNINLFMLLNNVFLVISGPISSLCWVVMGNPAPSKDPAIVGWVDTTISAMFMTRTGPSIIGKVEAVIFASSSRQLHLTRHLCQKETDFQVNEKQNISLSINVFPTQPMLPIRPLFTPTWPAQRPSKWRWASARCKASGPGG